MCSVFGLSTGDRYAIKSEEELTLLDISDFHRFEQSVSDIPQHIKTMGKFGDRCSTGINNRANTVLSIAPDIDDDSGFCGSNLSPPISKVPRLDTNDTMLLKAFINDVNDRNPCLLDSELMQIASEGSEKLAGNYPAKSRTGKYELRIISQPEEQHRARYLTEGSRGSIKDRTGTGHPVVKLFGYSESTVRLQCFIGHDKHIGTPHLFYQASKITGKNSTRCHTSKIEGTTVISLDLHPEHNMEATIDCIGILKERNVDVEQKLLRLKSKVPNNKDAVSFPSKKRSTRCRLIFRCRIPITNEILQVVSSPILCTQPLGTPEISKMSITECDIAGNKELFIIGKNFLKDTKVFIKGETENWSKTIEPDKEFLHSTHLVCTIPPYDGPLQIDRDCVETSLSIRSGGKYSEPQTFLYKVSKVSFVPQPAPAVQATAQSAAAVAELSSVTTTSSLPSVEQMSNNFMSDCSTFFMCPSTQMNNVFDSLTLPTAAAVETATREANVSKDVTLSASAAVSAPVGLPIQTMSDNVQLSVNSSPVPVLNQTMSQDSPINEISQMTDNELLRLINPSTFEDCKEV
ncbi:nuclear factor of activated T-cells 5-like protein [Dinothrombium tinctorium]|uniref:Nuclear factor of activated T-cells 5-like protein n=1 Tax=Dinothrombium tinctorium TaxID=1965070 RepID=A0A443RHY0_9ACAR|nr:nuclear factor of activated T-cells 5-like protein [Dinothrombium tinctorium]